MSARHERVFASSYDPKKEDETVKRRRAGRFGVDKRRELRDQRLSDSRYGGAFNDFTVGCRFAVKRLVAGLVWFQSRAIQAEAGECSFGVAEEQNLDVRILMGGLSIPASSRRVGADREPIGKQF
jgi:hypothetical protein